MIYAKEDYVWNPSICACECINKCKVYEGF